MLVIVYLQRQPNDTLDTSFGHTILRIEEIRSSGVLELKELTNTQFRITPKIVCLATCRTWILPSSCRPRFLHLTIHIKYVRGQTMLIRCYFAIIVMVDTIYFASSWSSLKFSPTFGIVHHVLLHHLDFYSDHVTLFPAQVWGGIHENFILAYSCVLYIYVCVCIFFCLINFDL